jgi:broad specificity phosphatase PhoE
MALAAAAPVVAERRQCVWIVRYGLTKFPLVEHLGPYNSPLDETEGLVHAEAIARALCQDVRQSTSTSSSSSSSSVHVYSSPFTRTTQTAHIIASALSADTKVLVEEGLTEWQQASLLIDPSGTVTYPPTVQELVVEFPSVDGTYSSVNPQESSCHPPAAASNKGWVEESEQDLFERCTKTLEGILHREQQPQQQYNSFIIVSHAPCDQAMAVYFEGTTLNDSTLRPWPLGGITKFSRVVTNNNNNDVSSLGSWEMEYYGTTDHMPGDYKGGLKAWSLPILATRK